MTVTSAPLTIAGGSVSLTCAATVIDNLVVTPDLQWLAPDGSNLVDMNIMQSDLVFTREVELNSLCTSQAGQYRCEATLTIPGGPTALGNASTVVRVQSEYLIILCGHQTKCILGGYFYGFHFPCQEFHKWLLKQTTIVSILVK